MLAYWLDSSVHNSKQSLRRAYQPRGTSVDKVPVAGRSSPRASIMPCRQSPTLLYFQSQCAWLLSVRISDQFSGGLKAAICHREESDILKRATFSPDCDSFKLHKLVEGSPNYGWTDLPPETLYRMAFIPRFLLWCEPSLLRVPMRWLQRRCAHPC